MELTTEKGLSFDTRSFGTAYVVKATYHNRTPAVEIAGEDGEPIAVLSVNIPKSAHQLGENEFFAKTWSENEEIAADAIASGIFRDTGRTCDGIVRAEIWAFN